MLQIRSISIFGFFGFLVGIVHVTVFAIRNIRTLFQFNSYVPKYDFNVTKKQISSFDMP